MPVVVKPTIFKIWNVHPRNKPLDAIAFLDLKEDMQETLDKLLEVRKETATGRRGAPGLEPSLFLFAC